MVTETGAKTDANVVSMCGIAPPVPTVCPEVVERLERFLADAKSGKIVGLAIAAVDCSGAATTGWDGIADTHRLGYAVARLFHRFFAEE